MNSKQAIAEHYYVRYSGLLEKIYKLILAEEKRTIGLTILRALATFISWSYDRLVQLRNLFFDLGILKIQKLNCAVISVGNLVIGGTGKTPMVLWLARFLSEEGWRVAIVSRGYRGAGSRRVLTVSDGQNILADSRLSGDEPQLLARCLPGIPVLCSTKRILAVEAAVEQFQCDVVILDDGFQHRFLARNLDVVMLDSQNPFGNGYLFPRGMLRERITALARAEALMLSRFDGSKTAEQNRDNLVRQWPDKPILTAMHRPVSIFAATEQMERPLSSLKEARVAAFAGIGRPDDFFQSLNNLGARLVYATALPDHHPITTELLSAMVQEASTLGPEFWLTTEKDWVRLPEALPGSMELWIMSVELDLCKDGPRLKAMVRRSLTTTNSPLKDSGW